MPRGFGLQPLLSGISVGLGLRVTLLCVRGDFMSFATMSAQVGDMTAGFTKMVEHIAFGLPFTTHRQI